MNFEALIPLIIKYGVPAAEAFYNIVTKGNPTPEDWANLKTLTSTNSRQQLLAILAQHGIDPSSPEGQALINLTPT